MELEAPEAEALAVQQPYPQELQPDRQAQALLPPLRQPRLKQAAQAAVAAADTPPVSGTGPTRLTRM